MKTYIEISQPTTSRILAIHMVNLQSFIQSLCGKLRGVAPKKRIVFLALFVAIIALSLGCSPFSKEVIFYGVPFGRSEVS